MKTGVLTMKNIASEDLQAEKSIMGMSAKGMDMAAYFMRDKIYSDKVLAVIREYICNAYDEHVKHNIQEAVEVKLTGSNTFTVRDFAAGLDEDDVRNVFAMYFESTKSGNNQSIGGFGIGSKSAHSYTDTFYVTSHHKGTKTQYICTLGAGNKGIPVGELYKVTEEPTTETGIEISLEVKASDVFDFRNKASAFVLGFLPDAKIRYEYNGTVCEPYQPKTTEKHGDFIINAYEVFPRSVGYRQNYFIRMGGVVYPYTYSLTKQRSPSNIIVIDVPIGKLTIPISRESIETIPANDKVFAEIEKTLDAIGKAECASLTTPKFGSVITKNEPFNTNYHGVWFNYSYQDTFPTTRAKYYHVSRSDGMGAYATSNNVIKIDDTKKLYQVYIFPDIKSLTSWHIRLSSHLAPILKADFTGYVWIRQSAYDALLTDLDDTIDISDCEFIDIKTMGLKTLPKAAKGATNADIKYMVYTNAYRPNHPKQGPYTAAELNQAHADKCYGGKLPPKDWWKKTKTIDELNARVISNRKGGISGNSYNDIFVNSDAMIESLKKLGWLTRSCPEYLERQKDFNDENERQYIIRDIENRAQRLLFSAPVSKRTTEAIKKKPDRLKIIEDMKNQIVKESSTRGRVFRYLMSSYSNYITREDVRAIMKLK